MKRFGWKLGGSLAGALFAVMTMTHPAQTFAQDATASIHGHILNPIGQPVNSGDVKLTTDRASDAKSRKYAYTFPIDASGNYKGTGIKPDNYVVIVFQADKSLDFQDSVVFKTGEDKQVDFDMSRKEYLDKMTPEEKKALEDYKKKNAEVVSANAKIANLNALLTQARADNKSGNYDASVTAMQQATTAKPDEPILWITLADGQLGVADTALKAAKAAGKPATDPDVAQKYNDAIGSYKKAIDLNAASKKPNPETAAAAYNQEGQAYGKMGDAQNASTAYDQAAKTLPANAGMYYFNEAATLYNAGKTTEAGAAADKAIAADPKRADAYYIKGQALIPQASVDPKTQKITAPPGCVEAYQQYLELAPDGPHAQEVKDILTGIGATVKSSYKAGKK
ncbi:tetratricopeptide repeat protein [Granulicella arctica]|uniref:Tetratricopeptide (TPR) repeat protein n=1 Tax=Granulicella arctica TaxID=940613 RepID=A0A7Y9TFY5_9BACT|nr:tetratricopeptide repeat protein [Granulicella arctica]NYF79301.1 tetratricopeptide (TPR) repeat protein [Granulicella arctica]